MKISKYTSLISVENRHTLIYCAFSGQFIVLKNAIIKTSEELLNKAEEDASLRERLLNAHVLLDDSHNEIQELKDQIEAEVNDQSTYELHVNPTLDCNFRCWYCYENHRNGSQMSSDTINSILLYIEKTLIRLPELKQFNLSFFGGEPLLCFDSVVKPLIEEADKICKAHNVHMLVSFTSNGYLLNKEISDYLSNYPASFQITLDGDKEQHDKTRFCKGGKGSFDEIIKNMKTLIHNHIFVNIRINYTTANAPSILKIADYFEDIPEEFRRHFMFDFHRVWQEVRGEDTEEIIAETKREFKERGFGVSTFHHQNAATSCYADKTNYVLINYNGDAFGCTARDFKADNRIGVLMEDGTIKYEEPVFSLRASAKFLKTICHECRIAPICGGGCRQRAFETLNNGNKCALNYDEAQIDAKILDIFDNSFC